MQDYNRVKLEMARRMILAEGGGNDVIEEAADAMQEILDDSDERDDSDGDMVVDGPVPEEEA